MQKIKGITVCVMGIVDPDIGKQVGENVLERDWAASMIYNAGLSFDHQWKF
jgi:hypothetical protein